MSLIIDISSIITEMYPNTTFILSSKFNANYESYLTSNENLPLIILDNEFSKEAEVKKNNNIQKNSRILINFLDLDSSDNSDAQSEIIRIRMEEIADRIAVQIYQLLPVRPLTNQKYKLTPIFHVFNSNLTGVALEMQVNYNEIVNFSNII